MSKKSILQNLWHIQKAMIALFQIKTIQLVRDVLRILQLFSVEMSVCLVFSSWVLKSSEELHPALPAVPAHQQRWYTPPETVDTLMACTETRNSTWNILGPKCDCWILDDTGFSRGFTTAKTARHNQETWRLATQSNLWTLRYFISRFENSIPLGLVNSQIWIDIACEFSISTRCITTVYAWCVRFWFTSNLTASKLNQEIMKRCKKDVVWWWQILFQILSLCWFFHVIKCFSCLQVIQHRMFRYSPNPLLLHNTLVG